MKNIFPLLILLILSCGTLKEISSSDFPDQYIENFELVSPNLEEMQGVALTNCFKRDYDFNNIINFNYKVYRKFLSYSYDGSSGKLSSIDGEYNSENNEFSGKYDSHILNFFRSAYITDSIIKSDDIFTNRQYFVSHDTYSLYGIENQYSMSQAFSAMDNTPRKIGDSWNMSTKAFTKSDQFTKGYSKYFGSVDTYKLNGFIEKNGTRIAVVESQQSIVCFEVYSDNRGTGSIMYANTGFYTLLIDYKSNKIMQINYKGKFNNFVDGNIANPFKYISSSQFSDELKKSKESYEMVAAINAENKDNSFLNQIFSGIKGKNFAEQEVSIYYNLQPEALNLLSTIILSSNDYKTQFDSPQEYSIVSVNTK